MIEGAKQFKYYELLPSIVIYTSLSLTISGCAFIAVANEMRLSDRLERLKAESELWLTFLVQVAICAAIAEGIARIERATL